MTLPIFVAFTGRHGTRPTQRVNVTQITSFVGIETADGAFQGTRISFSGDAPVDVLEQPATVMDRVEDALAGYDDPLTRVLDRHLSEIHNRIYEAANRG